MQPGSIETARKIRGVQKLADEIGSWKVLGIRVGSKTGSSFIVRLGKGKERKQMRLSRYDLEKNFSFRSFEERLLETFQPRSKGWLQDEFTKAGGYFDDRDKAIYEAMCELVPAVKDIRLAIDAFLQEGEDQKRGRDHRRAMAWKEVDLHLRIAMANGTTREDVIALLDELLVQEIMAR